jgi:putative membrane protein
MIRAALVLAAATSIPLAAHPVEAPLPGNWLGAWSTDPWIWIALVVPAVLYLRGVSALWRRAGAGAGIAGWQPVAFGVGWLALLLALASPLDALGGQLFWVHMVQHEALMLVAAPLLVVSSPFAAIAWGMPQTWRRPFARLVERTGVPCVMRMLASPALASVLHGAVLWAWHAPPLLALSLAHAWVHHAQHASFMLTALLFWWVVLAAPIGIAWLLATMLHTSVLGALFAFAQVPWYPHYAASARSWGLDALQDQQLAGLVMWVPGGLAYLIGALALLAKMLRADPVTPSPSVRR